MRGSERERRILNRVKVAEAKAKAVTPVKLVEVAIIRNGETHHGFRAHWELRAALGDDDFHMPLAGDKEGFWTSDGRFVDRHEAKQILGGQWLTISRPLLSSDVW